MKKMCSKIRTKAGKTTSDDDASASRCTPSSPKTFPSGLKLLYKQDDSIADIVFVHGLTGDRERTWTAKQASSPWPQTLLPSKFPDARILTFGYDASVADWKGMVSQSRIADHAWNLLAALSTYREEDDTNERPIVFVCHSLGGLVCQDALATSKQRSERRFQNILRSTRGIAFLGTPHHGAGLAEWAEVLAISTGYIKQTNRDIVTVLKRDSEVLARIQDHFHALVMDRNKNGPQPIEITCFYEELPLPGVGFVVPQHSAILPGYIPIGIRNNHMDMTRFSGVEDPGFVALCGELREWLKASRAVGITATTPADTSNQQEDQGSVQHTTEEAPLQRHWIVPFGRNKDFVGRKPILAQLLQKIPPSVDPDDCQRTAIEGLGGAGKTQIALEAAFQVRDEHPDCSVFWVPAVNATSFENAYREIGRELKVAGIDEDKADVKSLVKAALSRDTAGSWLLVIDNADDTELFSTKAATSLSAFLPFSPHGSVLFTTRHHKVAVRLGISKSNIIATAEMSPGEAKELLQTDLHEHQTHDTASTTSLLEHLCNLPLAIKQASAFMAETGLTTTRYLEHYRSNDQTMIKLLSKDFEDRHRYEDIQNPVAATWLISFKHISRDSPLAARFLKHMSFLAEKDIPSSLLPAADELEMDEALGTLKAYAFITQRKEGSFDIHRLVRLVIQNWLDEEGQRDACVTDVMQRFAEVFPFPTHVNRDVWMGYMSHALAVLDFGINKVLFGDEDPSTLQSMISLAVVLYMLQKYDEAEQMLRRTLELTEKVLGKGHFTTLESMNNLANVLVSQGKYNEAEQIHRQTLELREKMLGREHPSTLFSMNNLGEVLHKQGKYDEAEQMYRDARVLELM